MSAGGRLKTLKRLLPLAAALGIGVLGCEAKENFCEETEPIPISIRTNDSYEVALKSGTFTPSGIEPISLDMREKIDSATSNLHVMLQYDENLTPKDKKELESKGIKILEGVTSKTYLASIPPGSESLEAKLGVNFKRARYVGEILPEDKLSNHLLEGRKAKWAESDGIVGLNIRFHKDVDAWDMEDVLEDMGADVNSVVGDLGIVNVTVDKDSLEHFKYEVSGLDETKHVEHATIPLSELNHNGRNVSMVDYLQEKFPDLKGSGTRIAIFDSGWPLDHIAYNGRFEEFGEDEHSMHATHVTGIAIGNGEGSLISLQDLCGGYLFREPTLADNLCLEYYGSEDHEPFRLMFRGVAPMARALSMHYTQIEPYCFYNTPSNIYESFLHANVSWGAHEWTSSTGSNVVRNGYDCEFNGDYELTAWTVDHLVHGTKSLSGEDILGMTAFWGAGNERSFHLCMKDIFGHWKLGIPATSKNAIIVGASEFNKFGFLVVSDYTGFGPTDDGRIGVTVMNYGGGTYAKVISTALADLYCGKAGTSMATPLTAGIGLLLNERYSQIRHGGRMSPHLMKAILAGTAWDIGPNYVDYQSGFGHVDAYGADKALLDRRFREGSIQETGDYVAYTITNGSKRTTTIELTMAYTDVPGSLMSEKNLINDLDLLLIKSDGTVVKPMVLDPEHPQAVATEGEDHLNNIEKVVYNMQGSDFDDMFTVMVKGYDVVEGPVGFALVSNVPFLEGPKGIYIDKDKIVAPMDKYMHGIEF